jgi:hypothetical protein
MKRLLQIVYDVFRAIQQLLSMRTPDTYPVYVVLIVFTVEKYFSTKQFSIKSHGGKKQSRSNDIISWHLGLSSNFFNVSVIKNNDLNVAKFVATIVLNV